MPARRLLPLLTLALVGCDDAPPAPTTDGPDMARGVDGGGPPCTGEACEMCNGVDDDGDGTVDEGVPMAGEACGNAACGMGTWTCISGSMVCAGAAAVGEEVCNGEDDDCDGQIDEADPRLGEACEACAGQYVCIDGDLRCNAGAAEVCNGLDDDCDGQVDDGLTRPCGEETGACEPGTETCTDGQWGGCVGGTGPNGEECNGLDDDCDGLIDERVADCNGLGTPCANDAACSSGLCLDDDGSFYCSRACDPAVADDCGAGNRCVTIDGADVCIPDWTACATDCECPDGLACMPAANHPDVHYGCRPERRDGRPVGAECTPNEGQCATGTCLARTGRCVRWCAAAAECGGTSICDAGTLCVELSGVEQPICANACTADADCPRHAGLGPDDPAELCRYRPNADMTANVGVCDWPNADGAALGELCDGGADCAHGLCLRFPNADNYCTKGCDAVEDCPPDWRCEPDRLNGLEVSICRRD